MATSSVRAVFGNDRPLLYDVDPWNELGFGVANFSRQIGSLSKPIWRLADEIGKAQLRIMTDIDAQRTQYPSINTIQRLAKPPRPSFSTARSFTIRRA